MVGGSQVTESLFSWLGGCSGSWSFAIRHIQRLIFSISNLLCPAAAEMGQFTAFWVFSSLSCKPRMGTPSWGMGPPVALAAGGGALSCLPEPEGNGDN